MHRRKILLKVRNRDIDGDLSCSIIENEVQSHSLEIKLKKVALELSKDKAVSLYNRTGDDPPYRCF